MQTLFASRRRTRPATSTNEAEEQEGKVPLTWCRLNFSVTMTPPKTGRVFTFDRGPRTYRLMIWAPRVVVAGVTLALVTSHPWLGPVFSALKKWLGGL